MVDIYTDTNNELLKEFIGNNELLVGELEKISSEQQSEIIPKEGLTKEAFADTENRMFPVYDKASTLMSALYVAAQPEEVPLFVKEAVQSSCDLFGIEANLTSIEKVASEKVINLEADDFIFPAAQKLPVVDEETYKMSETTFLKQANEMSVEDVLIGSRKLFGKAHQYNVEPDADIQKLAMFNGVDRENLSEYVTDLYFQSGNSKLQELNSYITKEASQDELPSIALEIIKMYNNKENKNVADLLKKLSAEDRKKVIKILNKEVDIEKVASINKNEWQDFFVEDEITFKDELGNFDKVAFEESLQYMTPTEQEMLLSFIKQQ